MNNKGTICASNFYAVALSSAQPRAERASVPGEQWARCLTCSDNLSFLCGPCLPPVYGQQQPHKHSRLLNKTARWKGWISESTPAGWFFPHTKQFLLLEIKNGLSGLFKDTALGLQPSFRARFNNLSFCWIIPQSTDLLLAISSLKEKLTACILFIKTSGGENKSCLPSLALFRTLHWGLAGGNSVLPGVFTVRKTADKAAVLQG